MISVVIAVLAVIGACSVVAFVVTPDEPAFASDVSLAFIREIDASIRAAKGEKNGA